MAQDFAVSDAKRRKLDHTESRRSNGSRLFAPFRTIGLVSPTRVPFTAVPLGKTTFQITTSIGQNLQTYDLRRGLNLVFLSRPQCPETITATCAYRDRVFVAWGNEKSDGGHGVWVFKRGKLEAELESKSTKLQEIQKLLVFGSWIIGCGSKAIEVWRNADYQHYTTIHPARLSSKQDDGSLSSCICTLPTFLNKVFVGRRDGSVEIYNVSTGKFVHTIPPPSYSWGSVTAIAPAPAVGLIAIAHANGSLRIVHVEFEEIVLEVQQSRAITSISFRSDGAGAGEDGRSDGIMATASVESGDVTLWDLNRGGKIAGVLRGAHEMSNFTKESGITGIEFLPGQPVLVSSGLDNALRTWIFDANPFSPIPRPLHARSGHAAPVTNLKFLPAASDGSEAAGKWLLSSGRDRSLWGFSLRKDGQSTELSQGNIKHVAKKQGKLSDDSSGWEDLKCPPITAIACSLNRDGGMGAVGGSVWTNTHAGNAEHASMTGWESIVTSHEDDRYARTWFWGRKKAGRWAFETGDRRPVTSIAMTACGTFALVGSAGGSLDMFNLQSGIHRQRFPPKLKPSQAKQLRIQEIQGEAQSLPPSGHRDSITGIVVDNLNQTVVSTSIDGQIIFWNFATGQVQAKMGFGSASPTATRYNPISGLCSVACDDLCIRVVDIESKKVVRELWGCTGQIYDHCFSHDGRLIVACSMDSIVRTFDLATGHLVDAFKTTTCTNVAFSSTGEFLATAHAGKIGVNIWNNKSLFMHITSIQIDEDKDIIDLTASNEFDATNQLAIDSQIWEGESDVGDDEHSTIEQLDESLLTLSIIPQSRWQTLLNLETIRQRNKPIQPPEKPKSAPFFLGSSVMNGISTQDESQDQKKLTRVEEHDHSRISRLASLQMAESALSLHLQTFEHHQERDPEDLVAYLTSLPPSAADLDIRSLAMSEMATFVAALTTRLKQRRDFELVNTWMSVFLRVHGEFVAGIEDLKNVVLEFQKAMATEEARLSQNVGWAKGVVEYLRSAR